MHTPIPWAVGANGRRVESENEHGVVNDGWIICECHGDDADDNAALIVRAVNAHDDLVSALNKQHQAVDWLMAQLIKKDRSFMPSKSPVWPLIEAAYDAIAKAEKA